MIKMVNNAEPPKYSSFKKKFQWLLKLTVYIWLNVALLVLGIILIITFSDWPQSVGTSIVASAIVGFLFVYELRIERRFEEARDLYEEYGIVGITPGRSDKELYTELLSSCTSELFIIGHSLSRFYKEVGPDYLPVLNARDVDIRFLLIDPESPFVQLRQDEDTSPERVNLAREVRNTADAYKRLNLPNLNVRYYSSTPSINSFQVDGLMFVGPYFAGMSSSRTPALVVRTDSKMAKAYREHFIYVWENASRPAWEDQPEARS